MGMTLTYNAVCCGLGDNGEFQTRTGSDGDWSVPTDDDDADDDTDDMEE